MIASPVALFTFGIRFYLVLSFYGSGLFLFTPACHVTRSSAPVRAPAQTKDGHRPPALYPAVSAPTPL